MANRNGLPADWAQRTPAERRAYRLDRFVNPPQMKFVSPEAEANYKIRAQRYVDALNVQEPDRVPVNIPAGSLPLILAGVSTHEAMYDVRRGMAACDEFNKKYAAELECWTGPMVAPGQPLEILDYKLYAWPGHGLATSAPGYQFVEGEYMKVSEYDDFIRDPSDFWLRTYLPRIFGAFEPFRNLTPLTDIVEMPIGQLMPLALPEVQEMFRKLADAGKALQQRNKASAATFGQAAANGYPSLMMTGTLSFAPFDGIGDTLRGTKGIMMDMFRNGDKLTEAVEVMTELVIHTLLNSPMAPDILTVSFPLHKGSDNWMSPKQFERFYWPSLKRVMDALIEEGIIPVMFVEGAYNTRLDYLTDFPKGSAVWWFDQTDMVQAKKVLGDKFCIQGNVPSSLMVTGEPEQVKAKCRELIANCGQGGGYILDVGCVADDPKLDNLRAMISAVREYGVYRK